MKGHPQRLENLKTHANNSNGNKPIDRKEEENVNRSIIQQSAKSASPIRQETDARAWA